MQFTETPLEGAFLITPKAKRDPRGEFIKIFNRIQYEENGVDFGTREIFFSTSFSNVIRGMHFQAPPYEHDKIIFCAEGVILDVLLDLRKSSDTYGTAFSQELSSQNRLTVLVPRGLAHGFLSLASHSVVVYATDCEYSDSHERGVRWDSFGFDWRCRDPILSDRDQNLPSLADIESPF